MKKSPLSVAKAFLRWGNETYPDWDFPRDLPAASVTQGVMDWMDNLHGPNDALFAARDWLGTFSIAMCEQLDADPKKTFKLYVDLKWACEVMRDAAKILEVSA